MKRHRHEEAISFADSLKVGASIILLPMLLAGAAFAQDTPVVVDTLDWQRYYPLEIGNTWEYKGLQPTYISTIVGDTLANDHRYFIRRDSLPPDGPVGPFVFTFYLRYDTAGTVVTLLSLEEDTVQVPLPVDYWRATFPDVLAHFDMRMAFGDTLYYAAPDTLYYVQGGYNEQLQIGSASADVDALKCLYGEGDRLFSECYATDIGLVGHGGLYYSNLEYARVGGREYGRLSTPVEGAAVVPEQLGIETIYPNPFKGRVTVAYRLPKPSSITIEVFNVLGRRIWWEGTSVQAAGVGRFELQSREWPAGMYLVRLSTERGEQSVRSVVVAQ